MNDLELQKNIENFNNKTHRHLLWISPILCSAFAFFAYSLEASGDRLWTLCAFFSVCMFFSMMIRIFAADKMHRRNAAFYSKHPKIFAAFMDIFDVTDLYMKVWLGILSFVLLAIVLVWVI
jgi:hypothetical protein